MANERMIYELAGLKYSKGPPINQNLFITAISDYFLRHPERYKEKNSTA